MDFIFYSLLSPIYLSINVYLFKIDIRCILVVFVVEILNKNRLPQFQGKLTPFLTNIFVVVVVNYIQFNYKLI